LHTRPITFPNKLLLQVVISVHETLVCVSS